MLSRRVWPSALPKDQRPSAAKARYPVIPSLLSVKLLISALFSMDGVTSKWRASSAAGIVREAAQRADNLVAEARRQAQ